MSLQTLFRVGRRLPAASLGIFRDFLSPGIPAEDRLRVTTLRMFRESAGLMGELVPGDGQMEWLELENKLQAFEGFTAVRPSSPADSYAALWAMEGLGHVRGRSAGDLPPRELLSADRLAGLPAGAVIPMHTGSALAFAERLLADLDRRPAADRDLVWRWLDFCRDEFNPGYSALAVEALGLVARNLQPCRLARLDELLADVDPVLPEYLWHGVGRGLYFVPTHLVPWSDACRRAFAKAESEPPHEAGRRNAVAGLAWALTLVNVRSPEIVEAAVGSWGDSSDAGQAIANGVTSALLVWRQWAGWDSRLARFLGHRPARSDRARQWHRRVLEPCRAVLESFPGDLRRRDHLAALFRFQVPG